MRPLCAAKPSCPLRPTATWHTEVRHNVLGSVVPLGVHMTQVARPPTSRQVRHQKGSLQRKIATARLSAGARARWEPRCCLLKSSVSPRTLGSFLGQKHRPSCIVMSPSPPFVAMTSRKSSLNGDPYSAATRPRRTTVWGFCRWHPDASTPRCSPAWRRFRVEP